MLSPPQPRLLTDDHRPTTDQPDPEANERHKQDSLAKQKQGKGHWKPELASDSEESVKADRAAAAGHDGGGGGGGGLSEAEVKKLQDRTKQAAEEKTKHGTSARDGL